MSVTRAKDLLVKLTEQIHAQETQNRTLKLMELANLTSDARILEALNTSSPLNSDDLMRLLESIGIVNVTSAANEFLTAMPTAKVFFYVFYILIFVIGILGNALVCYVVFRNRSMQTVTNLFITNLALSDILLCTFSVPFTPLYLLTFGSWVFGKLFCHLLPYAQGVSVYISAFTLTAIAGDRFMVIIYPFKPRVSISVCLITIAVIWIEALVLTIPFGWFMEETYEHNNGITYCDEVWPSEQFRKSFVVSTSILQFVIPFALIAYCYIKICYKLRQRTRTKPGLKSARKEEIERERTKRTNRMLISMVLIFGASWLPLNLYNLVQDFYQPASGWPYAHAFFLLAHAIAMSSTCYNPFLYAWLNETFRKEFKKVLPCFNSLGYCIGSGGAGDADDCAHEEAGSTKRRSRNLNSEIDEVTRRHRSACLRTGDHEEEDTLDFSDHCGPGGHETIQLQEHGLHGHLQSDACIIVNTKTQEADEEEKTPCKNGTHEHNEDGARVLTNVNSQPPEGGGGGGGRGGGSSDSNSPSAAGINDGGDASEKLPHGISNSCAF